MDTLVTTPGLAGTNDFFEALEFTRFEHDLGVIFSDGVVGVLVGDRHTRPGVMCFASDWSDRRSEIASIVAVVESGERLLLGCPSGARIVLASASDAPDFEALGAAPRSILGNDVGVGVEMVDMELGLELYRALGFAGEGDASNGWAGLQSAGGSGICLMASGMCPHTYANPSLTFFNGAKNLDVIAGIRARGVAIHEEITVFNEAGEVDNVILREPGGVGFFIFSDG